MTDVYIYAALLLHKAGKSITEENINSILIGGVGLESTDDARVKMLVDALEGVDIKDVITRAIAYTPEKVVITEVAATLTEPPQPPETPRDTGLGKLFGDDP